MESKSEQLILFDSLAWFSSTVAANKQMAALIAAIVLMPSGNLQPASDV